MPLTVYKASAGSGKTFSLTVEYIRLLVMDPSAYNRILAVTFTNKATSEMKERILQQLWGICHNDPASKPYLDVLMEKLKERGIIMDASKVISRASEALRSILHHYGEMRVMTIDSFMQSLVKGLGRELGLGGRTEVELDGDLVVGEAVDHMMENLRPSEDGVLKDVTDFIISQMEDGKNWNVKDKLKAFSLSLLKEDYQIKSDKHVQSLSANPDLIRQVRSKSIAVKRSIQEEFRRMSEDLLKKLEETGLEITDLSYGTSSGLGIFCKSVQSGNRKALMDVGHSARVLQFKGSADAWFKRTDKKRQERVETIQSDLFPMFTASFSRYEELIPTYISLDLVLENIHDFGLLSAVARQMSEDNRSKGRLLLAQTNHLLNAMIGQEDAPFILEKSGGSLEHVMIDEFQDTSLLQWNVLMPLCREVLSKGGDCLIVGDVKQSIYRWRNSDWNILNDMGDKTLGFKMTEQSLRVNRRSKENIIRLNNALFPKMVEILKEAYAVTFNGEFKALEKAFLDVIQECTLEKGQGQVLIKETPSEKDLPESPKDAMAEEVCQQIQRMLDEGIRPEDITILMRQKKQMPSLAQMIEQDLGIMAVSEEAFLLGGSVAVDVIIRSLEVLLHPADTILKAALAVRWTKDILGKEQDEAIILKELDSHLPDVLSERERLLSLDIEELIETLTCSMGLFSIKGEVPYIAALMEGAEEFRQKGGGSLEDFIGYYDTKLAKTSISEAQGQGVRLMTIHKSKGLEFKNVIMPWADWKTQPQHREILWCESGQEPLSDLSVMPVNYSDAMNVSCFSETFQTEWTRYLVDNLNLLYVAMTRAVDNMVILFPRVDHEKSARAEEAHKQISLLLSSALDGIHDQIDGLTVSDTAIEEGNGTVLRSWTMGESLYVSRTDHPSQEAALNPLLKPTTPLDAEISSRPLEVSFRASNHSKEFVRHILGEDGDTAIGPMQRGTVLHDMLSRLDTLENHEKEVERFVSEHQTGMEMEEEIRRMILKVMSHERARTWFQRGLEVLKEREILVYDGGKMSLYRPDRIIRMDDGILVIDFKFAQKKKEHLSQVRTYMELIRQMELTLGSVRGVLYYVDHDETIDVTL